MKYKSQDLIKTYKQNIEEIEIQNSVLEKEKDNDLLSFEDYHYNIGKIDGFKHAIKTLKDGANNLDSILNQLNSMIKVAKKIYRENKNREEVDNIILTKENEGTFEILIEITEILKNGN